MKPCDVPGIGTASPASERDVSEEQQVVLVRAVGARSLPFPVCLDDLVKWLELERGRQVCGREYCLEKNWPQLGELSQMCAALYWLGFL